MSHVIGCRKHGRIIEPRQGKAGNGNQEGHTGVEPQGVGGWRSLLPQALSNRFMSPHRRACDGT